MVSFVVLLYMIPNTIYTEIKGEYDVLKLVCKIYYLPIVLSLLKDKHNFKIGLDQQRIFYPNLISEIVSTIYYYSYKHFYPDFSL